MIIGISGKIGSGKDTLAEMLRDHFIRKRSFEVRKFASKLKEMVAVLTGCSVSDLESQDFKSSELPAIWKRYELMDFDKPKGIYFGSVEEFESANLQNNSIHQYSLRESNLRYRDVLQLLGTEGVRRVIHPNAWINALMGEYRGQNWIITDVRFPNEADAVRRMGGMVVRINRPGTEKSDQHESETALDGYKFDHVVENDGDLASLMRKTKDLAREIILRFP